MIFIMCACGEAVELNEFFVHATVQHQMTAANAIAVIDGSLMANREREAAA